jgi:hypothetical protein
MNADKVDFESNAFVQWIILLWFCFRDAGLWWDCEIVRSRKMCDSDCQVCWVSYLKKKYFQVFQIHFSVLEHNHTLSQEALDHDDLSVLTATIGAAALVKNSLWVNLQCTKIKMCPCGNENGGSRCWC